MMTFEQYMKLMEFGPLSAQLQSAKNSYNPDNTTVRCGDCGQPIEPDESGTFPVECPVCGGEAQNYATDQKKVITPNMQPRQPNYSPGWAARRNNMAPGPLQPPSGGHH